MSGAIHAETGSQAWVLLPFEFDDQVDLNPPEGVDICPMLRVDEAMDYFGIEDIGMQDLLDLALQAMK